MKKNKQIRVALAEKGMTQKDLAELLDMSQSKVSILLNSDLSDRQVEEILASIENNFNVFEYFDLENFVSMEQKDAVVWLGMLADTYVEVRGIDSLSFWRELMQRAAGVHEKEWMKD
jgi:transcriptional regulator with XRE-family HTH domain